MPSRQAKEHAQALERFKVTAQAEEKQRKRELEDLKFADPIDDTDQWPKDALDSRAGLQATSTLTPDGILARLFTEKGVTAVRVQKARGLANRQRLDWALVLAAMTPEQRAQVEG